MNGDVVTEAPRPRPLSGGLWTLFSWLRRDEHSSSESLSSVGSDRTAASFAFLAPAHYDSISPVLLPPPGPPTDSYKKRVRDRNLRRQHDRDITLHRKYGLYGYDAFSLPSARRVAASPQDRCERDRRATSECLQRRAHVPGKRRAPLPPSAPTSLTRRARKRPAPLPPVILPQNTKENIDNNVLSTGFTAQMNHQLPHHKHPSKNNDSTMDCKSEKYSKNDASTKDVKVRPEKSFLKQIFENKKRNSAIDTATVRLLPSISELDKQAAEIIEKYRLKELAHNDTPHNERGKNEPGPSNLQMESWICTRCLRKYNASVITCNYCLPLNKVNDSYKSSRVSNHYTQTNNNLSSVAPSGSKGKVEDKEKLKEMLKEMKDSLPKRPKNDLMNLHKPKNTEVVTKGDCPKIIEAPTLRIGSTVSKEANTVAQSSCANTSREETFLNKPALQECKKPLATVRSVIITQPVVLEHTKEDNVVLNKKIENKATSDLFVTKKDSTKTVANKDQIERIIEPVNDSKKVNLISNTKYDIHTPLKISSLLNPIYIPKNTTNLQIPKLTQPNIFNDIKTQKNTNSSMTTGNVALPSTSQVKPTELMPPHKANLTTDAKPKMENKEKADSHVTIYDTKPAIKTNNYFVNVPLPNVREPTKNKEERMDQYSRRRDLINQLEQSIAKGDETAAAKAAVQLAQLRLSCSVLSFSSHIVAEASTSSNVPLQNIVSTSPNENKVKKVEDMAQNSSPINIIQETPVVTKHRPVDEILVTNNNVNVENSAKKEIENEAKTLTTQNVVVPPKIELVNNFDEKKGTVSRNQLPDEPSTSKGVIINKENHNQDDVPILVWVEDKEATRGPVQLHVRRNAVMGELRRQAENSLGLAAGMQRWIVGRTLCSDDSTHLETLAGPDLTAPFYLCLVESETKGPAKLAEDVKVSNDGDNVYDELVKLEKQALVSNAEVFECGVCLEECLPGGGAVLRECVHSFCKECLSDVVHHSEEPVVACPAMGCRGCLQEREIRALVSTEDYEKWLGRGLAAAESGTKNAFHCRTRDCTGWALCDPGVRRFPCPVCKCTNCVTCQAIHEGETCEQHLANLQKSGSSVESSQTDEGTRAFLNTLISRGEALECPDCSAIIMKKWGCDWVKCSACKTEICWVTKGRRWGPAGRGDTSAGCRCGVDGKRCHPSCGYCH